MGQQVKSLSLKKEFQLELESFNNRAEKFKLIFNASPDMIFILSNSGLILDANDAAIAEYQYSRKQIFGMSYEKLLTKAKHVKSSRKLLHSAQRGAEINYEWLTQTSQGKKIPVDVRLRSLKLSEDDDKSAVVLILRNISLKQKADEAITSLARASNVLEFDKFLKESVRSVAELYGTKFAFIGRLQPDKKHVSTLVVWAGDRFVDNFTYSLDGTPCKDVMDLTLELVPDSAAERYPEDEMLIQMGIESYFGAPMISDSKMLGLISVMDDSPLHVEEWTSPILSLFSNRLAVEIERFEMTNELQKNKEELEEIVKERTAKIEEQTRLLQESHDALEEANQEMQSFCYSVSHDLRAPLRGISGFSDVILEDYEDKLDELGKEYLHRIKDSTINMSALIDGMLQLSRVSHQEAEFEEVDLSLIAEEIFTNFSSLDKNRKVNITIQPGLICCADRGLIIILLQNLLGNAWKYTNKVENAEIEFVQEKIEGENFFVLKDNGAGFDMKHAGKLFEPFKRLHGDSEFPGSGIGLATVKSIVTTHNGDLWAAAEVNKGAKFYFNLKA